MGVYLDFHKVGVKTINKNGSVHARKIGNISAEGIGIFFRE